MPEEKLTIGGGSADLSGPDESTKNKISENILVRAKREAQKNILNPDASLLNYIKNSRSEGEGSRNDFYDNKRAVNQATPNSDASQSPNKFGEGRKQYIQSSELERRRKNIQSNQELSPLSAKKRPQALVRQMASFQANKNMILREGVRNIREENINNKENKNNPDENNLAEASDENKEANLNKDKQQERGKLKTDSKFKQSMVGVGEKIAAIRQATDKLLQQAFKLALETFTLSMFYVYLHFFLNLIFPKYFCKLGHEWVPEEIKKSNKQEADKIGEKIGLVEKPGVGCSCVFHLTIIILICAAVYFMINWKEVAWDWFKGFFTSD